LRNPYTSSKALVLISRRDSTRQQINQKGFLSLEALEGREALWVKTQVLEAQEAISKTLSQKKSKKGEAKK